MTKIFLSFFVLAIANHSLQAQMAKADHLGLIAELAFVKRTSEDMAIRIMNYPGVLMEKKIAFVNHYNDVRLLTDQLILQLMVDCRSKRKSRKYKKLNYLLYRMRIDEISDYYFSYAGVGGYVRSLKTINSYHNKLLAFNLDKETNKSELLLFSLEGYYANGISARNFTSQLQFGNGKVDKIRSGLNEVRLLPLEYLTSK